MDIPAFCRESRVLVVAGKGGVGKTTVSGAMAWMAAAAGLSVLIVELEGKSGIGALYGRPEPLEYEESELGAPGGTGANGAVRARRITPDDALIEYLADHGLQRVSKRLVKSGVVDVVATAIPGIKDVLVLGKVKQLEQNRVADLIVVDAPATGHAVTFLTSANGLLDAARGGPVRTQAADVVGLLTDPARCRVMLVCLPEEMPVSETVDAAYLLEDRAGVQLGPVVVNNCEQVAHGLAVEPRAAAQEAGVAVGADDLAALGAARAFTLERAELQAAELDRLARELPLPQLRLPALSAPTLGPPERDVLACALGAAVETLTAAPQ